MASQESLDAAKSVGTPDHELTAARQDYASAEQLLHDGQAAYRPSSMSSVGTDCELPMRPFAALKRLPYALVSDSLSTSWQRITGAS